MTNEKARAGFNVVLLVIALASLTVGQGLRLAGKPDFARTAWMAGVVPVLVALVMEIARSLWRGEVGLDVVAALSMSAALAFGETLAAAVVALMYSGGTFWRASPRDVPGTKCTTFSRVFHGPRPGIATAGWTKFLLMKSNPATFS